MIHPRDLSVYVIKPTLEHIDLWSPAAGMLLLGTFLVESTMGANTRLKQVGGGPALGIYQVEPATHDDIRLWIGTQSGLFMKITALMAGHPGHHEQMITNLSYATAIVRCIYRRIPTPLPAADDTEGLANYWKRFYNTRMGKGRPEEFTKRLNAWPDALGWQDR